MTAEMGVALDLMRIEGICKMLIQSIDLEALEGRFLSVSGQAHAALSTTISDIPFDGPCAMTQMGMKNGEFIVNPSQKDWDEGDLKLTVASTATKVIMIEAGANEIPEAKMIEAIYKCHDVNQTVIAFINKIREEVGKPKHAYTSCAIPEEMFAAMREIVTPEQMEEAVFTDEKQQREENIREITDKFAEAFAENEEWLAVLDEAVYQYQKKTVRKMILKDHKRPDGRAIDQIRPLAAEVDLIPRVHGSAMFTRGQTQICDVVTLAPLSEVQKIDGLDENVTTKRYMHQYNFPSYSVGETKPSRGPGRREIGHGALAERALLPVLPSVEEFPYAIRAVSETFESNGSTSMASTCASCMALMAAGVPIKSMVAGISCGLVTGDTDDDYIVLTDIQGLEDFFGDMDFKVTGTHKGITAIQMDIKIHGLTRPIIEEAIARTRKARVYILDEVMAKTIAEPRAQVGKYAPKIIQMNIDPAKIGEVVGQRGKTINAIIEKTGVKIDITDEGSVSICGVDADSMEQARKMIATIVTDFEAGMVLEGDVVSIKEFGAFIEFAPGKEGMALHHVAVHHEGRDDVGKALVDHKVAGVGQHSLVQACNVAQQVVEAVTGHAACGVHIDAVKALHDLGVVRDGEIRHDRLAEALCFHVVGIVRADGHAGVDHLGNGVHDLLNAGRQCLLFLLQLCHLVGVRLDGGVVGVDLCLQLSLLCLISALLQLTEQRAVGLAQLVAGGLQGLHFLQGCAVLGILFDDLVHQRQLCILKLLFDVFLNGVRVLADKFDIQHD